MKKLIENLKPEKIWPFAIVITGLMLSASITFASFSFSAKREVVIEKPTESKSVLGLEVTVSPTPSPIPSTAASLTATNAYKATPTPKPSATPVAVPTPVTNSNPQNPTPVIVQIISTPAPVASLTPEATPTSEPSPSPVAQKIAVEIKQPDAQMNFELEIIEGIDACAALQKAKDEGKINSLTISDKYLESFGTLLIEEINGYKNNWVFTVNGESPNGCSLINLKNGDKVVWEFLNL